MAWFFSRETAARAGKPKTTKSIARKAHLEYEHLENRVVFSANVWLPQQVQPLDGVSGYNQSFQAYHAALGDLMPTVGMSSGVVTLAGNFSLTESGSYPLAISAIGPYGGSDSFEFSETGTSLFCLTAQGSVSATGFSVSSLVLTQTVSLAWAFAERDPGGNLVQNLSGTSTFVLAETPAAPFDPFFWAGFNWLGPTWHVSSLNGLSLPSLAFSALTVAETGGADSYTMLVTSGSLAITGNATAPLYQEIAQSGQESYSVAFNQSFGTTRHGNASFSLAEAGAYSAGSFALSSVAYSEAGNSTGTMTADTARTDAGTGTGSALQNSTGNLHTFSSSSAQSYGFTEVSTLAYAETAQTTYGLTQQGTFGSGQFNLSSLSHSGVGSGGFSLTLTRATTQTGTLSLTDSQAATDSMGVAGILSSGDSTVESGQFTLTSIDTITESQRGLFTLSELGAYGAGSWNLGTVSNIQSLSGTFSEQRLETYTAHSTGTITSTGAGNDSYTLNYGGAQTTSGAETSTLVETLTNVSDITSTNSFSMSGTVALSYSEIGQAYSGTYSLSSYVLTQSIAGNQVTQNNSTQTDSGTGASNGTIASNGSDATQYGGSSGSELSGGSVHVNSAFNYTQFTTQNGTDTLQYAQSSYEAGTYGGGHMALSSVAYGQSVSDSWSLSALQDSSASGSQTATGAQNGHTGGTSAYSGQSASVLSNGTANFTSTSNYTTTSSAIETQSGFTSWTSTQQGTYGGVSFAFGTASYQGQGSFAASGQVAKTQSYAGTYEEIVTGNDALSHTSSLQITSSTGQDSALHTSQQTVVQSGTLTLSGTRANSSGWSLYQKGNFAAGSWSLSSISYQESQAASSSQAQAASSQQSGLQSFSSTETVISGDTSAYGGTISSQGTFVDKLSGHASFTETDAATLEQSGASSYSLSQQGTFSGQSYSFPTVTYQAQGNSAMTATAASNATSSGNSVETTILQSRENSNTNVGGNQSGANGITETSTSSFSTSGTATYQETTTSNDTWAQFQSGSYAGDSLSLSSFNSSETFGSSYSYRGTDATAATGSMTVITSGTQRMAMVDSAFMSGTFDGVQTLTGSFTSSAMDSYSGSGQQTASQVELGRFSNFSYSLDSVVYQSTHSYTQAYSDLGTTTQVGTVTDFLTTDSTRGSTDAEGFIHADYNGGKAETLTSSGSSRETATFGDTFTSSGSDSLYQAGNFSGGSYSLSSVAYHQSASSSWTQTSADSSSVQGQQTQNLVGTYTAKQTISYTGNTTSSDTITLGMTVTGTDTVTAEAAVTLSGGDSWSVTELGSYSGYSYSFSSVVYQGLQTESLTQAGAQTAQFSGGNTNSAGENQITSVSGTMGLTNSTTNQGTVALIEQDSSSAFQSVSGSSGSTFSWFHAGTYGGGAWTFTSWNETVSVTDSATAFSSLSSSETLSFGANSSSTSLDSGSGGTTVSNSFSSQAASSGGGTVAFQQNSSGSGSFTLRSFVSYTQSEHGSYAAGSFAFTDWSYLGTQTGSYAGQISRGVQQTLTASGTFSNNSAGTFSSSFSFFSGNTHGGGGVMVTVPVSDSQGRGESTTFNGTITTGDSLTVSEAGTYSVSAEQNGSYSGASFAFGSMFYNVSSSRASSKAENSGYTVVSNLTSSQIAFEVHSGATLADNHSGASGSTFTRQDTIYSNTTATSQDASAYALYEAGSYGSQSWSLSSFNLLTDDQAASTYQSSSTDDSLRSGSFSESYVGLVAYNVSGTFIDGESVTTIVQNTSATDYSVSEQGTFSNATLALSSFAFLYAQSSQQTITASGGSTQTFSGADDTGLGASNPTFTGTGGGTVSYENDQSSSSSLSQQGSFAGGAFNLSAVNYSGSASNSFSASDASAKQWSGGYSGTETITNADSGADSQSMSATGSFAGGSWSLSSYALQGSAQQADSHGRSRVQSLGTIGAGSTFATSDASTGSSSLYQSGTQSAGTYANGSYSYHDNSATTITANAQAPGSTSADTRTEQSASTIVLGGTQQDASAASYSYQTGSGSGTFSNSGSAGSAAPASAPVVQFGTPDPGIVAAAGVGQLVGVAATQSAMAPAAAAQPAAGDQAPGATAPVPMTVNLRPIATTADWMGGTLNTSEQVVTNIISRRTLHGFQPAAEAAVDAVINRARGASFALEAWKVLNPALKLAQWAHAGGIGSTLVDLLSLDDPSGLLAKSFYRQMEFASSSNDPLVREVDKMLYNDGQPLTAGSAPLYGTYYDPRTAAGFHIMTVMLTQGPLEILGNIALGRGDDVVQALGTVFGGSSTQEGMSAQQALSQIGPILADGVGLVAAMLTEGAAAGVRPLRGGIPGIGRRGSGGAVCDGAVGRALDRSSGRALVDTQPKGFWRTLAEQNGLARPTGAYTWTNLRQACFSGRMLIDVPGGKKRADEIQLGDLVASRSEFDSYGPVEYREVQEVFVRTSSILNLHVAGQIIETTAEHPFYVPTLGWISAGALQIGDPVCTREGRRVPVQGVAQSGAVGTVYNWRIAVHHTYFVSANDVAASIWAHNAGYGNAHTSAKPATLYQLIDKSTEKVLKTGITNNIKRRYSNRFLDRINARLEQIATGSRRRMADVERIIVMRDPGPLNHEQWAGRDLVK